MEGADTRIVHIVYFLSSTNRVEHPHLIEINHPIHNDIRLQDVKRWLSEFRGKNMADSFAWSCKRRYKMGYIWQDLTANDVVTPISHQEYVLKGSLISMTIPCESSSCHEKTTFLQQSLEDAMQVRNIGNTSRLLGSESSVMPPMDSIPKQINKSHHNQSQLQKPQTKSSRAGGLMEPETSGTTDESVLWNFVGTPKHDTDYSITTVSEIEEVIDDVKNRSSCSSIASSGMMKNDIVDNDELILTSPQPQYSSPKQKTCSDLTSNVLLNILTCGVVETNDSAIKLMHKSTSSPLADVVRKKPQHQRNNNWESCFDGVRNLKESTEFSMHKTWSATATPAIEPNCSQCGKGFKPEKLHKHMKSCRGMKN